MLVLNDLHIAVNRTGGTTPQSLQALRNYLRDNLQSILTQHEGEHVVINGDFFDGFQVDTSEVIKAYEILADHMRKAPLTMVMGNHDASAKGDKISSFHLLCHFLKEAAVDSYFKLIDHNHGFCKVAGNVFAISHCMNQSLFDLELDKAMAEDGNGKYLLLHCNYKNGFAENSDHSLNINDEQVAKLMISGWHLVLGHEHIGYSLRAGRVIVVGNQFPSSIADCLGNQTKHALVIDADGHRLVETWEAFRSYTEIDWRELAAGTAAPDDHQFVRVTGDATALESAEVIRVVSALRQASGAFVITNSVKVEGQDMVSDMADQTVEDIKAFDVLNAIFSELEPDEIACVKGLLNAE